MLLLWKCKSSEGPTKVLLKAAARAWLTWLSFLFCWLARNGLPWGTLTESHSSILPPFVFVSRAKKGWWYQNEEGKDAIFDCLSPWVLETYSVSTNPAWYNPFWNRHRPSTARRAPLCPRGKINCVDNLPLAWNDTLTQRSLPLTFNTVSPSERCISRVVWKNWREAILCPTAELHWVHRDHGWKMSGDWLKISTLWPLLVTGGLVCYS